jgi:BioD-like phosphotransacetylase family protein
MKALYVTSLHRFSGKTAVCLALGRRFQKEGRKVGYFKPISAVPWELVPGRLLDEDADFVRRTLGLSDRLEDLVGVVLTPELVQEAFTAGTDCDLLPQVVDKYKCASAGKDIMVLDGGASLREGLSLRVDSVRVAQALDVPAMAIVRFNNHVSAADACIAARMQFGERLLGTVINIVPDDDIEFFDRVCRPGLEDRDVPVLGSIPMRPQLQAISIGELADVLDAEFLTLPDRREVLIESLIVGAMSAEKALPRIRRAPGTKAVITGGDRADIQLVALETTIQGLILTGHLRPVPEVLRRAEECGVPVLLVRTNTMETVEAVESVFGKTRLGQAAKLEQFEALLAAFFDYQRLYMKLGLS